MKTFQDWIRTEATAIAGGVGPPPVYNADQGDGDDEPQWDKHQEEIERWFSAHYHELIRPFAANFIPHLLEQQPVVKATSRPSYVTGNDYKKHQNTSGQKESHSFNIEVSYNAGGITDVFTPRSQVHTDFLTEAKRNFEYSILKSSLREVFGGRTNMQEEIDHGLGHFLGHLFIEQLERVFSAGSTDPLRKMLTSDFIIMTNSNKVLMEKAKAQIVANLSRFSWGRNVAAGNLRTIPGQNWICHMTDTKTENWARSKFDEFYGLDALGVYAERLYSIDFD